MNFRTLQEAVEYATRLEYVLMDERQRKGKNDVQICSAQVDNQLQELKRELSEQKKEYSEQNKELKRECSELKREFSEQKKESKRECSELKGECSELKRECTELRKDVMKLKAELFKKEKGKRHDKTIDPCWLCGELGHWAKKCSLHPQQLGNAKSSVLNGNTCIQK